MTDIRFARSGDVNVAYRVIGYGPVDLIYAQGAATHLEVNWELPAFRRYCERLAEFSRLILFDKRGGLELEDRGRAALNGIPGEWQLFAAVEPRPTRDRA